MERIGIFAGSFDPFTIGHDSIVRRALPLFDRIVIGVGVNERKQTMQTAQERVGFIGDLYADEPRIAVEAYSDLTVDFARRVGAHYIIKGVRSVRDFEYEREQADINRQLDGLETVFLFAEPQLESVSSSLVRELKHFGKDVSEFLPTRKRT
ncbi:MAG: pantetheine-phosphate adenylyltransferase [Prevotella sp.]|nr:pantetheine-phosphate adenylyltransferase [Prevotella sp.]